MLKKLLPIFLLSLVVLLSVFYIKQTGSDQPVISDGGEDEQTVAYEFAQKRLEVLSERSEIITDLETSIATGEMNTEDIAAVVDQINKIYYLKYTEVELEDAITILGYDECLVIIANFDVSVAVSSNEISAKEFIQITNLVKGKLNKNYKVSVEAVSLEN